MLTDPFFYGAVMLAVASGVILWKRGGWPEEWPVEGEPVILGLLSALIYLAFQMGAVAVVSLTKHDLTLLHFGTGCLRMICAVALLVIVRSLVHNEDPIHRRLPRSIKNAGICIVCYLLLLPLMFVIQPDDNNQQATIDLMQATAILPKAALFFNVVVAAPIFEELLFRGFIQGALRRAYPAAVAIPISSFLFAIVHERSVWLPVLILGLLLGAMYEKRRGIWAPYLIHLLNNLITFVFIVVGGSDA